MECHVLRAVLGSCRADGKAHTILQAVGDKEQDGPILCVDEDGNWLVTGGAGIYDTAPTTSSGNSRHQDHTCQGRGRYERKRKYT